LGVKGLLLLVYRKDLWWQNVSVK